MADISFQSNEYKTITSLVLPAINLSGNYELNADIDLNLLEELNTLAIYKDYHIKSITLPNVQTSSDKFKTFTISTSQGGSAGEKLNCTVDFNGYTSLETINVSNKNKNLVIKVPDNSHTIASFDFLKAINCDVRWTLPSDTSQFRVLRIEGNDQPATSLITGDITTDQLSNIAQEFVIIGNNHTIGGAPPAPNLISATANQYQLTQYRVIGKKMSFSGSNWIPKPHKGLRYLQIANEDSNFNSGTHTGEIPSFENARQLINFNIVGCKLTGDLPTDFTTTESGTGHSQGGNLSVFKIGGRSNSSKGGGPNYHSGLNNNQSIPLFYTEMKTLVMTNLRNSLGNPIISDCNIDAFNGGFPPGSGDGGKYWQTIDLRYNNMTTTTVDKVLTAVNNCSMLNPNQFTLKLEGNAPPTGLTDFSNVDGQGLADTGNTVIDTLLDAGMTITCSSTGTYAWPGA